MAVAVAGCASAASATAASTTPSTPGPGRNTHITLYSINSDGPTFHAIVTGVVGDHGQAVSVYRTAESTRSTATTCVSS